MSADPFEITDELPTPRDSRATARVTPPATARATPDAPRRAFVGPVRPRQDGFVADLLGRTGRGRILVRMVERTNTHFAVDRFRLHDVDKPPGEARRRLSDAELDALPWKGAGEDPGPRSIASGPAGESTSAGSAGPLGSNGARA